MQTSRKTLADVTEYQVGWIAALPCERTAATAVLDERHNPPANFAQSNTDINSYTFGRIGHHNIVIASLPAGIYGLTSAARTVLGLAACFPWIKIGLLVGVGAAIPESNVDIRLGDVVVSKPEKNSGGVIQYDFRKETRSGCEMIGTLAMPPIALLSALSNLQAEHGLEDSQMTSILEDAYQKNSKFDAQFRHPGQQHDTTPQESRSVDMRPQRPDQRPHIHYGTIASGATLVKKAKIRGEIFASLPQPCICLEMEAAGLQNDFPCLVIRGICDYADERKNDIWQPYASATAAAFAKELLMYLHPKKVEETPSISAAITLQHAAEGLKGGVANPQRDAEKEKKRNAENEKILAFLRTLYTCPYAERKDRNIERVKGTCKWFIEHSLFRRWRDTSEIQTLWVSADPGCGKSVLARYLVDKILPGPDTIVCYFFFKEDYLNQNNSADAGRSLLRQLLVHSPDLATKEILRGAWRSPKTILETFASEGDYFIGSFLELWRAFKGLCNYLEDWKIICVLDALDECQKADRRGLIEALRGAGADCPRLKILATSRRYHDIDLGFSHARIAESVLHLDGDTDHEKQIISQEIDIVLKHRINTLTLIKHLTSADEDFLVAKLASTTQRTYLWAHLTLDVIEQTPGFTRGKVAEVCSNIPATIDEAYERILSRSTDQTKARTLLGIVVAAERPITVAEMSLWLSNQKATSFKQLTDDLEPEESFRLTVRQLCGLFVVIVDSCIYLLHQTAREFLVASSPAVSSTQEDRAGKRADHFQLQWKQSLAPQHAHRLIAERCFWLIFLKDRADFHDRLQGYCDRYWAFHFERSDFTGKEDVVGLALKLCSPTRDSGSAEYNRDLNESKRRLHSLDSFFDYYKFPGGRDIRFHVILMDLYETLDSPTLTVPAFLGLYAVTEYQLRRGKLQKVCKARALRSAVIGGKEKVAALLLSYGADPNMSVTGHSPLKMLRLRQRLLPDTRWINFGDVYAQYSCLSHAIAGDRESLVKILLDAGANANSRELGGLTPLTVAAGKGNHAIIAHLLSHNARIDYRNPKSWTTALEVYVRRLDHKEENCQAILPLLWHEKIIRTGRAAVLDGLLRSAIRGYCPSCCSFFLQKGATINCQSRRDVSLFATGLAGPRTCTPLMEALGIDAYTTDQTKRNTVSLIRWLLDAGADLAIKDDRGASAIHYVSDPTALEVLLDQGADINAVDGEGRTLLMLLLNRPWNFDLDKYVGLLRAILIKHGANIRLRDHRGRSALDRASYELQDEKKFKALEEILAERASSPSEEEAN